MKFHEYNARIAVNTDTVIHAEQQGAQVEECIDV